MFSVQCGYWKDLEARQGRTTAIQRSDWLSKDDIVLGRDYVYVCGFPIEAKGHLYRAHKFVLDVPSYQQKVLVEALTGDDKGLWFTCSIANFCVRYRRAELKQE